MSMTRKLTALIAAAAASLSLAACSTEGGDDATSSASTAAEAESSAESSEAVPVYGEAPTAAELNNVLMVATDPNAPMEERVNTVQGGDTVDPALFDTMTYAQQESGANFQVVDPVYPGYTPESVLSTVTFTLPDQEPQMAENVEFVFEDGTWKISQSWACILINNTVAPEQVPQMCLDETAAPEAGAEAPAEAPAEEAPAEQAPAEAPAEQAPAEQAPAAQ